MRGIVVLLRKKKRFTTCFTHIILILVSNFCVRISPLHLLPPNINLPPYLRKRSTSLQEKVIVIVIVIVVPAHPLRQLIQLLQLRLLLHQLRLQLRLQLRSETSTP